MKLCAYCGRENPDDAASCRECGTKEFKRADGPSVPGAGPDQADRGEQNGDWVTLMTCRTLAEADLVVSELDAAGITAFLPDENLMQAICFNVNTYGFVRVQVSPKDAEAAKALVSQPANPEV